MNADKIPVQMTVQEYIGWIESLEEFAKHMNKPEKAERTKGEQIWRD